MKVAVGGRNTHLIEFGDCDTIKVVKAKISDKLRIPPEQHQLLYAGQELEDDG